MLNSLTPAFSEKNEDEQMKKVAVFCIPAHGHTNPMLPVVRELTRRGDEVRFYSFSEFQLKI